MTARLLAVVGASLVALAGLPAAPAAAVSTDQSYWVPANRSVVLHGHGFGHGHGMSQYGAQGAAKAGLTYQQIIDFYYPRTSWSTVTGNVRVLITSDTTSDVVVSRVSGLSLHDLGSGRTYPLPAIRGVTRWRVAVDDGNRSVVDYLTGGWHRWRPGGRATLAGDGEFSAPGNLTLHTPSGTRSYRGALRAASPSSGSSVRDTVNVLSMDDYLKGVIADEMPASWHPEAVKAQAVAARTYATWSRSQYPRRYYQICDTTSCQVYGGVGAEDPRSTAAVTATARRILTYGGKPAFTQFSSSSGGWTSAGSVPYLTARADPYDGFAGNPVHAWTLTLSAGRIESAYPSIGTLRRIQVVRRDGNGHWQGRVWTLVLDGTKADATVSGDSFRSRFGLRSTWFAMDPTPIISRYTSLGGARSPLGKILTREYAVPGGAVQRFQSGRIYYSRGTGAHELHGAILTTYRSRGGVTSALGFPTSGIRAVAGGQRATFEHGTLTWTRATGRTVLTTS
ncbi:MAG: SpoIID/LytB domain-containing protein [Friedmanniella sp.]